MPVYNEAPYVVRAVKSALDVDYPCEIELIVVDDGSRDGTSAALASIGDPCMTVVTHPRNFGKGAAVRSAASKATGDYFVILDTDLEYDPTDIPRLLDPAIEGKADVVYGNRTFGAHSAYSFWYVMGNKGLTTVANALFNSYIGDLETCLKLMPAELFRSLDVRSSGFGIEAEITGKLLRRGFRPYEVPISYRARARADGKKITWRDGVAALYILCRERARPAVPRRGRADAGS
jgi:dolichol-phosphate hexosyltransferase